MRWRRILTRLAGYGTAPYPPPVRRRLRIMNVAAYLIALFTLIYTLEQIILDFQTWKPVIFINVVLIAIALGAPLLHRFNEIAGALTLSISENIGLFALTWILGTESGLHMQYFACVAGYFVVFGLGRIKLIIALILAGLVLHLAAWAWFPQERALLHVRPYDLAELYVTAVVTTSAMVAAVVYYAFRLAEQAQEETDALLHNILPAPIVDRLKGASGAVIADELADASVLFADLTGFVALAKRLGPARTVELLNAVVSAFDDLADAWRVEKIKTIGDAYMAACGIPEPACDHAQRLGGMALAMQATLSRISQEREVALALRIGIATGPVLAGVIGAKRLTYDVWGDTVNLAARLEGQSQPGRVLVSGATKAHVEQRFAMERCGALDLKGFGVEEAWYLVQDLRTHAAAPALSGAA
ncbi:MAG: adenylate/guanylate cyclase domain-containing protein [Hyphomicrobiaceae bacterium]|nr:adenylate/guanylate cyclase domain-containing protein [Hyphomicrobiaceae bacterium]